MWENKIILKIGYSCNHACDFCHAELNKQITQKESIKTARKIFHLKSCFPDVKVILLSGWEPTIQTNFFQMLSLSYSLWFQTWVVTNGSMIYRPDFLEKCSKYNFTHIYLSLHGGTADIHNVMSGAKDNFSQIDRLLKNLSENYTDHIELSYNCVITKNNVEFLEDVILYIKKYPFTKIKFSLLEPKGLWYDNIQDLYVKPDYSAEKVKYLIDKYPDLDIHWDGFPYCLFLWYEKKISNLRTENIYYMSEIYEDQIFETDYGVREYSSICNGCSQKTTCYGNFQIYNEIYGDAYLKKLT